MPPTFDPQALARRLPPALLVLVVLGLGTLTVGPARAQQSEQISLSVQAGFDGYYREGTWVPVRVTLANSGPDFAGRLQVASPRYDGTEIVYTRETILPSQSRKEFFVYASAEGFLSQVRVSLTSGPRRTVVASDGAQVLQITGGDLLYGVIAGAPMAFAGLQLLDPLSGNGLVARLTADDLPPVGQAWRSLDVLVIEDADTGGLGEAQRVALADWIASGGRLIVVGGPSWQKTAAGVDDLLPVSISGARSTTDLAAVSAFASFEAPPVGPAVIAVGQPRPGASVLAAGADQTPLIIARRSGWGEVDYLAFDPALEPFKGWDGMESVYRNLLARSEARPGWAFGLQNWSSAADAVNAIPGLDLPSTLLLCGFLGVYILLIGPANYLSLRRLKRLEWAWLTIPVTVLAFSGLAYVAGFGLRGSRPTLHRLSVAQVWPDSDRAQVDSLIGVYSPRRTTYDVEIGGSAGEALPADLLVRPLPSNGYGNLNTPAGATLAQEAATRIQDLRVEVGAVEAFAAQGHIPAPRFESELLFSIIGNSATLEGTITNASPLTLRDAVLLGPGNAQRLGDLPAGATLPVSLPIGGSRATPAAQAGHSALAPAGSGLPAFPLVVPPPYGAYDSTIDDVLGGANYYDNRETFRKFALLSAVINSYSGAGRGSGVYLVGWTDASPVPATILDRAHVTSDVTAWFIRLAPELVVGGGQVVIHPALMTWSVLDAGHQPTVSPYDAYIYDGSFVIQFAPSQTIEFSAAAGLTLHLESYGLTGAPPLEISLWDFDLRQFAVLDGLEWGDNAVPRPGRYVGPSGEIRVRVAHTGLQPSVNLERLDFTLVVER